MSAFKAYQTIISFVLFCYSHSSLAHKCSEVLAINSVAKSISTIGRVTPGISLLRASNIPEGSTLMTKYGTEYVYTDKKEFTNKTLWNFIPQYIMGRGITPSAHNSLKKGKALSPYHFSDWNINAKAMILNSKERRVLNQLSTDLDSYIESLNSNQNLFNSKEVIYDPSLGRAHIQELSSVRVSKDHQLYLMYKANAVSVKNQGLNRDTVTVVINVDLRSKNNNLLPEIVGHRIIPNERDLPNEYSFLLSEVGVEKSEENNSIHLEKSLRDEFLKRFKRGIKHSFIKVEDHIKVGNREAIIVSFDMIKRSVAHSESMYKVMMYRESPEDPFRYFSTWWDTSSYKPRHIKFPEYAHVLFVELKF